MQELLGIIASVVIGATLILILGVIAWRGQSHTTSSAQYSAAKASILDFAQVIEEDLGNMGAGRSSDSMRVSYGGFTGLGSFDSTATPAYFEFYSWTDRDASVSHAALDPSTNYNHRVKYVWEATGRTVQVFDYGTGTLVTKPTYVIRRSVDGGGGGFDDAGSSIETLTEIDFKFYDVNGTRLNVMGPTAADTLRSVRAIEVALTAASPLGSGYVDPDDPAQRGAIDQTRWVRRFRPPNLIRVTN